MSTFGPAEIDVAVIVRGGGAKASLDVFDMPMVAHAIATASVPVWTGIGHAGDRTVADEVSHRCFATPTAVGQGLVATVATAWDDLARALARIARLVDARLVNSTAHLDSRRRAVSTLARSQLALREQIHARTAVDLRRSAARSLDSRAGQLTNAAHTIRVSGRAELRNAHRRLSGLALDTAGAARRRCIDSSDEVAATAESATAAAAQALRLAAVPMQEAGAKLKRSRFDRLLDEQAVTVTGAARQLDREVRRRLAADDDRAASQRAVLEAYDPRRQLARGWTLTHTPDGRLLRSAAEVTDGDAVVTTFADGAAESTVTRVARHDQENAAP